MANINYIIFKGWPKDDEIYAAASEIIGHKRFKYLHLTISRDDGEVFTVTFSNNEFVYFSLWRESRRKIGGKHGTGGDKVWWVRHHINAGLIEKFGGVCRDESDLREAYVPSVKDYPTLKSYVKSIYGKHWEVFWKDEMAHLNTLENKCR